MDTDRNREGRRQENIGSVNEINRGLRNEVCVIVTEKVAKSKLKSCLKSSLAWLIFKQLPKTNLSYSRPT